MVAAVVVSLIPYWLFLNSINSEVTSGFFTFLTKEGIVVPLIGQFCSVLETSWMPSLQSLYLAFPIIL